MTGNFIKLKKNLKSFAKRVKDFRYTDRMLITFLLTGALGLENNLLAAPLEVETEITNQIRQIDSSVSNLRKNLQKARNENTELIKQSNLELIQLMEQGDHIIRPIWSSWQFGNNYYFNNWRGLYNGRGDKSLKTKRNLTRSSSILNRSVSSLSSKYNLASSGLMQNSYGNTELRDVEEPIVEWEVSANVNPRRIAQIEPLVLAPRPGINFQNPELPAFEVPDGDVEVVPPPVIPDTNIWTTRLYYDISSYDYASIRNERGQSPNLIAGINALDTTGPISQTHITGTSGNGKIEMLHNNTNEFTIKSDNTTFTGIEGTGHTEIFTYSNNLNKKFKYLEDYGPMGVRLGGGHNFKIENMDIISSGTIQGELVDPLNPSRKYRNTFNIIALNGSPNGITTATLKEGSTIVSDSINTTAVSLQNLGASNKAIKFTNEGLIKSTKLYGSIAGFFNFQNNTAVSRFINNGDILLDGTNSNVINSFTNTLSHFIFENNKNITLSGTGNAGVRISSTIPNSQHPISIFKLNNPIVIEGKRSSGFQFSRLSRGRLFEATIDGNSEKSFFNVELYGQSNTGMQIGNGTIAQNGLMEFKNFKLKSIDGIKNTLLRINKQNGIKFSKDGDNEELTIEGGDGNIGLNIQASTGMVNEGVITIKESANGESKNATGIVSSAGSEVENKGKMTVSGDRVRALFATKNGKIENHAEIVFDGNTTESTKGSTGMYANHGGIIKSDETTKIKISKPKSVGLFAENRGDNANYLNTSKIKISKAEITATDGAFNIFANKGGEIQLEDNVVLNTGKDSLTFYTAYTPFTPGGKIIFEKDVTANVKKHGTVFYYDLGNAPVGTFNFSTWYANNFTHNNSSKLKLNMEEGGRVLFLANGNLNLSGIPANLSAAGPIEINGTGYISAAMVNSNLELDQDVNLDDDADPYNELEILSSSITNSKIMTGTKNGQLAIAQENNNNRPASKVKLTNNNKITLTGEGSVGIYAKRGEITNNGDISIAKNSVGLYLTEDNRGTAAGKAYNNGLITLGEGSSGILYRAETAGSNTALPGGIYNNGKIISASKNTFGMNFESPHGSKELVNGNAGQIELAGENAVGMYAAGTGNYNIKNLGKITVGSALSKNSPAIAIYTNSVNSMVENSGKITAGDKSLGIYGYSVNTGNTSNVSVGNAGTGIYSLGGNLNLQGKLTIGTDEAKGVLVTGDNQIVNNDFSSINLDENSFAVVNTGNNNQITSNTSNVSLKNKNIFLYSEKSTGNIINNTKIKADGNQNYGIYTAGAVSNFAEIDLTNGVGNVGIYSTGQNLAENYATIKVGASKVPEKLYSIGMAAGYYDKDNNVSVYTGKIENANTGKIEVTGKNGIGMYAIGNGSVAINNGEIHLSGQNSIGMFLDQEAVGINNGLITATPDAVGAIGAVATNRAVFKNYGIINILPRAGVGALVKRDAVLEEYSSPLATVPQEGSSRIIAETRIQSPKLPKTGKEVPDGSVEIVSLAGDRIPEIKINGKAVNPVEFDISASSPEIKVVGSGDSAEQILETESNIHNPNKFISKIGMYIDTSGIKFTNPIQGLNNLSEETEVDLILGTEASKYTNSKAIKIKENILEPYNATILSNPQIKKWHIYSGSLTWVGTVQTDVDGEQLKSVYLVKIPYTSFAKDTNVYNFSDGLEQRYDITSLGSKEKILFDKLNSIGKNEKTLLAQAFDEMMGHQYANIQQRTYGTGRLIDKEISYLSKEWDTKSKQSNKIKTFGIRDEYRSNSAGIIDYTSSAYGFAYLKENEAVRLGNSSGWYAGMINNKFKFKDAGKSKENQAMLKLGIFKTMPPKNDYNGSLQWTVSGESYLSRNSMHRKYLVVDEIFNAKSDYSAYGAAVKNELSKEIRTSQRTSIKSYGSLKLEYGRFENIKEKSGEMRLEVKGNDYYLAKSEIGSEFKYKQPIGLRTSIVATLGAGYEKEFGKIGDVANKAKVSQTNADWFNIRGEKENKKGNFKTDFNIGIENQIFGITLNGGYDAKGKNVRGGIGLRAIY